MTYPQKTFDISALEGISPKQVEAHLGLYAGYVKHVNLILSMLAVHGKTDDEGGKYSLAELRRRFAFEFDGMRMHEYYFEQFEGGPAPLATSGPLADAAKEKYGGTDELVAHIKEVAGSRGTGWAVVYWDARGKTLHTVFVGDHEVGQLAGLPIVLALDLWEHAFMVDYLPAQKKDYVDAFFANLNGDVVEKRFANTMSAA